METDLVKTYRLQRKADHMSKQVVEFSDLELSTQAWIMGIRHKMDVLESCTDHSVPQVQKLIIEIEGRLRNKKNRKLVLSAILGQFINSQNDLSKEQHIVLIDEVTKAYTNNMLQEIEDASEMNTLIPGAGLMIAEYTPVTRKFLNSILNSERMEFVNGKQAVICAVCGEPIEGIGDFHEALITRGHVMKSEGSNKIFSRYNVVERHHVCPNGTSHGGGTGGQEIFEACAKALVKYEGYEAVHEWLLKAEQEWPVVGKQTLIRFIGVFKEPANASEVVC